MTRGVGRPAVGWVVAVLLLAGCSDVVRLPDCIDCRPVEMRLGETLEVELGSDRAVTTDPDAYTWAVADDGTMSLVAEDRGTRSESPDEFIGGYSRYVIYQFEPTVAGDTQMRFELLPADDPSGEPATALEITVIIDE